MRILKFIILITFLFNSTAYPYHSISNNLRVPMIGDKANKDRLESAGKLASGQNIKPPSVGHVEPVADAYAAIQKGDYDKAYELVMEGLLGEDYVVNMETAIGILNTLAIHYNQKAQEEVRALVKLISKYQKATDQKQMKIDLMNAIGLNDVYDIAYFRIAVRVVLSTIFNVNYAGGLISNTKSIIGELKAGKLIFSNIYEADPSAMTHQIIEKTINLRDGIGYESDSGNKVYPGPEYTFTFEPYAEYSIYKIEEDFSLLIKQTLGVEPRTISEDGIKHLKHITNDLVSSRSRLWGMHINNMSTDDIGRCLRSLGKDVKSPKAAITKKLTKLQQKRPETVAIIREKALELLEIDEANFRDRLQPFIGDYIKFRDAIRQVGFKDDAAEFYRLFDKVEAKFNSIPSPREAHEAATRSDYDLVTYQIVGTEVKKIKITDQDINKAFEYIKRYGDFEIQYTPPKFRAGRVTTTTSSGYDSNTELYVFKQPYIKIFPLTNFSTFKLTPTLLLDTEVTTNLNGFKDALAKLRTNEGNIPVVLLTEETKESIIAKLKGIDLTGVQFRTKTELGLQDLDWGKDDRVSLIDGIDNLKCIPLTSTLCETYKDLQKVRDQV